MRLHDLQVGQRFSFIGKHRGEVFEVVEKKNVRTPKGRETYIIYHDVIHKNQVISHKESKTFRMGVELVTENRVVEFTKQEVDMLADILHNYYKLLCEQNAPEPVKSNVNKLYLKITGLPGRRRILPEG